MKVNFEIWCSGFGASTDVVYLDWILFLTDNFLTLRWFLWSSVLQFSARQFERRFFCSFERSFERRFECRFGPYWLAQFSWRQTDVGVDNLSCNDFPNFRHNFSRHDLRQFSKQIDTIGLLLTTWAVGSNFLRMNTFVQLTLIQFGSDWELRLADAASGYFLDKQCDMILQICEAVGYNFRSYNRVIRYRQFSWQFLQGRVAWLEWRQTAPSTVSSAD